MAWWKWFRRATRPELPRRPSRPTQWWISFSNPRYVSADGHAIDCTLVFKGGTGEYTAHAHDIEPNGRQLYAAIVKAGNIAPYVPPLEPDRSPKTIAFAAAGDGFAMHAHGVADAHTTTVTQGAIRVRRPVWDERIYRAGKTVAFAPGEQHELVAVEPGTEVIRTPSPKR